MPGHATEAGTQTLTPSDRAEAVARGRRLQKTLTIASVVACLSAFLYPAPYILVIGVLIALPWVGIETVRRSNGLFRIDQAKNDARHLTVGHAVIFPSLVLALRAALDYNVLQTPTAFVLYAAIGGALSWAAAKSDRILRKEKFSFVIFCAIAFAYGFGVATQANALLDRSPGTNYSVTVLGKHISHGRSSTYYHLELAPWGPRSAPNNLQVKRAMYQAIQCGDVALLTMRKGALGLNWYYLRAWQQGAPTPCK